MDKEITEQASRPLIPSWPFVATAIALLLPTVPVQWPSNFYLLLRISVCAVVLFAIYQFYRQNRYGWIITLAAVAWLFNPISTFHLQKTAWVLADLFAALLLAIAAIQLQLGPNPTRIPFYRRLADWLDENVADPTKTPYEETRYARLRDRIGNTIGLSILIPMLCWTAYEFINMFLHWDTVPWPAWFLLTLSIFGSLWYFHED